jgi:hypothetical protein
LTRFRNHESKIEPYKAMTQYPSRRTFAGGTGDCKYASRLRQKKPIGEARAESRIAHSEGERQPLQGRDVVKVYARACDMAEGDVGCHS